MPLLDRADYVLSPASLFKGGGSGTVIVKKIIQQFSLRANAHQIDLTSNHSSGKLKTIEADIFVRIPP